MLFLRTRVAAVAGAVALALTVTACTPTVTPPGTQPQATSASAGASVHNQSDIEFAQMMVVHHRGAIEMAGLAEQRAVTPEVKALATRIKQAQDPEIQLMTGWLRSWGEPEAPSSHSGMGHGGMDMDGLDQAGAMRDLSGRSGRDFDKRFLELMTAHHEGAVEMARTVLAQGSHPDVRGLAERIIADQTAEIAEMRTLLGGLGA